MSELSTPELSVAETPESEIAEVRSSKPPVSSSLQLLACGESAQIAHIAGGDLLHKQCQALGLAPGAEIKVLRKGRGNGPLQVKSQGSYFAIRAEDAAQIYIHLQQGDS